MKYICRNRNRKTKNVEQRSETMTRQQIRNGVMIVILGIVSGCFPSKEATSERVEMLSQEHTKITVPTKVVLQDASVALFPKGFTVANGTINGIGERYTLTGTHFPMDILNIPVSEVSALTKYDTRSSAGAAFASFLHGIVGGTMTGLSIYCLLCPKCCFGSCPTVYTYDGKKYTLEAELFSHCISRQLEDDDIDFLAEPVPADGGYKIRMTNEALETHYVDKMSVFAAYHPKGTHIYPTSERGLIAVGKLNEPTRVVSRSGVNVSDVVRSADTLCYRSDEGAILQMASRDPGDWLDVKVDVPVGVQNVRFVVRLRNTLLSTELLYNVVLASQGFQALAWTDRMDTDSVYAAQFRKVYRAFSGVAVKVDRNGEWIQKAAIADVGPLVWKTVAVIIPVESPGEQWVRFQFVPDNFMIDMIAFDPSPNGNQSLLVEEIGPSEVKDNSGVLRNDVMSLIENDDDRYLITNPGESYRFVYPVTKLPGSEVSIFVRSKGYYTEWIRGGWVRDLHQGYQFDLSEPRKTLHYLAVRWLEEKKEIEAKFFDARIPVKEVK